MSLKVGVLKHVFNRYMVWRLEEIVAPKYPVLLGYPIDPVPRWGYDKPAHPQLTEIVEAHRGSYQALLKEFEKYVGWLNRIPIEPDLKDASGPYWNNGFFSRLDAIALYCLVATKKPKLIVEVGSGNSTRFSRRAIVDHELSTRLVSIDPSPRLEVDAICDEVIRSPLESTDLRVFDRVQRGDFVFIDDSHRSFTNSDATTFFIDVLPRLPAGVTVHIHDIFIPLDYPPEWSKRHYSEQYLLACYLLGARGGRMPSVLLPNVFISFDDALRGAAQRLWQGTTFNAVFDPARPFGNVPGCHGTSFWIEIP
ncbi:MAG: class I SAM-dependent methyltransferase [Betaproteobacteria bacterium]